MQRQSTSADHRERGLLDGVRVLDLSRVMAGPYCTAMLADAGAEVIKVEMPGVGEEGRHFGPYRDGESAYFLLLNRNKSSITIDLKSPSGLKLFKRLAAKSDVIVENYRPGVARRLGIDYEAIKAINPKVVYASISGFGQEGPLADRPALDLVVQAMSGLMSVTGQRDGPPTAVGESVCDVCAGMFAAWGITTALFDRERAGEGRHLDVAMLDSILSMLLTVLSIALYTDREPTRVGNRHPVTYPVDAFAVTDGHVVLVVPSDRAFVAFCKAIGQPGLADDERFLTNEDRNRHEDELRRIIEAWTRRRSADEVVAAMHEISVPAARVQTIREVLGSEHVAARGMIETLAHPTLGSVPLVRQPVRFLGVEDGVRRPPPLLGADTREVLARVLDLDNDEISELEANGAI